jgi:hypothetical protein
LKYSSNLQSIALDNTPTSECTGFGLNNGTRVHDKRSESMPLHCRNSKNDTVAVEMGDIDGKPHAKRVH